MAEQIFFWWSVLTVRKAPRCCLLWHQLSLNLFTVHKLLGIFPVLLEYEIYVEFLFVWLYMYIGSTYT